MLVARRVSAPTSIAFLLLLLADIARSQSAAPPPSAVSSQGLSVGSTAQCYNFDGSVIDGDEPCNPGAHESICCGQYWTCLNGLCSDQNTTQDIGSNEALYARATCTDPTWTSSVCPQFCLNNLGRGITLNPGNDTFCCQQDLDQPCYPDPKVKTLDLGTPLTTIGVTGASPTIQPTSTSQSIISTNEAKATPSRSQSAGSSSKSKASPSSTAGAGAAAENTPTASATNTAKPSSGLGGGAIAGIVLGVVFAILAVVAALIFFRHRRRKQAGAGDAQYKSELLEPASAQAPTKGYYEPTNTGEGQGITELDDPNNPRVFGELPAGSQTLRAEMTGSEPAGRT